MRIMEFRPGDVIRGLMKTVMRLVSRFFFLTNKLAVTKHWCDRYHRLITFVSPNNKVLKTRTYCLH